MYKKVIILIVVVVFSVVYLSSSLQKNNQYEGHVIMTRIPVKGEGDLFRPYKIVSDYQNAQIITIDPKSPKSSPKVLTENFASACSPELSYDNQKLVFAGKKDKDASWQIWMLNLDGSKAIQITKENNDCFDPVFLPDGKIAFSRTWQDEKLGTGLTLYSCNQDGTGLNPITFHPHSDYASTILHDGRILTMSRQEYPETGDPKLIALRPDGTKAELFFDIPDGYNIIDGPRETSNQTIVFLAVNQLSGNNELVRIKYKDPYNSQHSLYTAEKNRLHSFYPLATGNLLVSYKGENTQTLGIHEYDPKTGQIGDAIYQDEEYHLIDPIMVEEKSFVPKQLPSTLDDTKNYGIMVCLNSDQSVISAPSDDNTKFIRVLGVDGILGEFPVAEDGSFYIKLIAKTPVRFQSLNEQNEILRGPSSWIWLMPHERRGCVGCHEKKSIAPDNKVPQAINKAPVEITAPATATFAKSVNETVVKGGEHEAH